MRPARLIAAAAATLVLLTGCGSGGDADPNSGSGPLVVYTNSNADGRAEWLTEQAREAGFEITIVGAGGGETTNRLLAESGNPVADVVFGLNEVYFDQLQAEEIVDPYTPAWSDGVDPGRAGTGPDRAYWPIVQQGIVLAFDSAQTPAADAPQQWTDLANDPRFAGRYQTPTEANSATTQLVVAGILTGFRDDDGEFGVSEEGWATIERYFANGTPAVEGTDLYARLADGEVAYGQIGSSSIPGRDDVYGTTTDVVRPATGVPYAIEQVGVVSGTDQLDRSRAFVDWFGSPETQSAWSAEFDSMPAHRDAIARADPAIVAFHEGLPQQDIDWAFVRENLGSWAEKIELEYLG